MSGPGRLWVWLSEDRNRNVLGFLGAGIAAVAVAVWQLYLHFAPSQAAHATPAAAVATPAPAVAPVTSVDTAGLERLQSSQKHALDVDASALDKISQQIEAAGNPPPPASSAKH
jgi:hypothetical protein